MLGGGHGKIAAVVACMVMYGCLIVRNCILKNFKDSVKKNKTIINNLIIELRVYISD